MWYLKLAFLSVLVLTAQTRAQDNRVVLRGKAYYLNGINVAWNNFSYDLSNYDSTSFEGMFTEIAASGGNAIRWWWLIDAQDFPVWNGSTVEPLPQSVYDNLDQAFRQAERHNILIMPSLWSFDLKNSGKTEIITNTDLLQSFNDVVLTPLVQRYSGHPAMGPWEICNEPEWLLDIETGSHSMEELQVWHALQAAAIHKAHPEARVTTGNGMYKYLLEGHFSDEALMAAAGGDPEAYFDFYQTHYYSWMHVPGAGWSYAPYVNSPDGYNMGDKPVIIGEFPAKGDENWTSLEMHTIAVDSGYAGTFSWAYFDNRKDTEGTWADAKPGVEAIAAAIPEAMVGEGPSPLAEANANPTQTLNIKFSSQSLEIKGSAAPEGALSLWNMRGQRLAQWHLPGGALSHKKKLPQNLAPGIYRVTLQGPRGKFSQIAPVIP